MALFDWLKFGKSGSKPVIKGPSSAVSNPAHSGSPTPMAKSAQSHSELNTRKPASSEALLKDARTKLAPLTRACYVPRVMDGKGTEQSSHFCGNAALRTGEEWPTCGRCRTPMQLLVQLSSGTLPPGIDAFGSGLLQLFYCVNDKCEPGLDDWLGFGENQLVRVLPIDAAITLAPSPASCTFPSKVIVGWETKPDDPNHEEAGIMGIQLSREEAAAFYDGEGEGSPLQGEKLLGWPYWVQWVEYLDCPECGERMTYVFQVDSERNIPYMFGDMGVGHISICRKHPHRGGFRWACS
ncbi:MAG: DUF1963 domain-containing protein [Phycisphaerales bacterium]